MGKLKCYSQFKKISQYDTFSQWTSDNDRIAKRVFLTARIQLTLAVKSNKVLSIKHEEQNVKILFQKESQNIQDMIKPILINVYQQSLTDNLHLQQKNAKFFLSFCPLFVQVFSDPVNPVILSNFPLF